MSAPAETELTRAISEAWPRAQARWSSFLLLSAPTLDDSQKSVAQIDLSTRAVTVNGALIAKKNLLGSVEAILAHEIGHHVRYPATLATHARLRLLEKSLIPLEDYSLLNLFTDLLINEHLGGELSEPLAAVYRAFVGEKGWKQDPAFLFYLAIYEELWRLPAGDLLGRFHREFSEAYPSYRADAQFLAQDLFPLAGNLFTQFIYFASVVARYVKPRGRKAPKSIDPNRCGPGEPSPDDWADAITPSAAEAEAAERALREGWITPEQADRLVGPDARDRRILDLPGSAHGLAERVPEVMAAYYRQQAERYLLKPPARRMFGEAVVPTTHEDWEPGDPLRAIDWLATLTQRGHVLGAAQPLRREAISDYEGLEVALWQVRLELYLDVSGSMPNPTTTLNAMTLAAQILAVGALRAGGAARALLYSGEPVSYWEFCRSEVELSRFLMHYIGGGTRFPFEILAASLEECRDRQPIRVVISDFDFDANYRASKEHAGVFAEAARRAPLILLLHHPRPGDVSPYTAAGAKVVIVRDLDDFPRMAGELSAALFPAGGRHGG